MQRRDALKALSALPMMVIGQEAAYAVEINPKAKYLILLNGGVIDPAEFCATKNLFPAGTPVFIIHPHDDIDNTIRIFKIEE